MSRPLEGKDLLDRLLGSETKGELLMLFHKNPGIVDSRQGVARRIGKSPEQIARDVEDFTELGLFKVVKAGKLELISFDRMRDSEIQDSVTRHIMGTVK
jgi:hypothetical protein